MQSILRAGTAVLLISSFLGNSGCGRDPLPPTSSATNTPSTHVDPSNPITSASATPAPDSNTGAPAAPSQSMGEDLGFRFNDEAKRCQDPHGNPGFNPQYYGECGDLQSVRIEGKLEMLNLRGAMLTNARFAPKISLKGSTLDDIDLSHALMAEVDLSEASLHRAKLQQTHLKYANLKGADFSHADLSQANLGGADLTGANLSDTKILAVEFTGAILKNANLCGARSKKTGAATPRLDTAATLDGAKYGATTQLPFDAVTAKKRGMKRVVCPSN